MPIKKKKKKSSSQQTKRPRNERTAMIKTTRFRPIAPRPQEGANATKDKPSATAPAKATSSVKVEAKKAETLAKVRMED